MRMDGGWHCYKYPKVIRLLLLPSLFITYKIYDDMVVCKFNSFKKHSLQITLMAPDAGEDKSVPFWFSGGRMLSSRLSFRVDQAPWPTSDKLPPRNWGVRAVEYCSEVEKLRWGLGRQRRLEAEKLGIGTYDTPWITLASGKALGMLMGTPICLNTSNYWDFSFAYINISCEAQIFNFLFEPADLSRWDLAKVHINRALDNYFFKNKYWGIYRLSS